STTCDTPSRSPTSRSKNLARRSDELRRMIMIRKRVYVAGVTVVLVAATVLLARSSSVSMNAQQQEAAATDVKIDNFSFGPGTLTVAAGRTVTWTNGDDIPHNVVSTD